MSVKCDLTAFGGTNPRGSAVVARELAKALLDIEAGISKEILPKSWTSCRQAWIDQTTTAKTIKEVSASLLNLENGVRILNEERASSSTKTDSLNAWRKTVSGVHTYELLAKHVTLFKKSIQDIAMKANKTTDDNNDEDGQTKRKLALEDKARKQLRQEKQRKLNSGSSLGRVVSHEKRCSDDRCLPFGQTKARGVPQGITIHPGSPSPTCEVLPGGIYQLDKDALPIESPSSLTYIRTVLVEEKTRLHVLIKFPSAGSLRACFGKDPLAKANEKEGLTTVAIRSPGHGRTLSGEKGINGIIPELDEKFTMTPRLAERVLVRAVSGTEYGQRAHLWSFWVIDGMPDRKNAEHKYVSDDSDSAKFEANYEIGHPDPPDSPREVGAVEALMLLMPIATHDIMYSSDGSHTANEGLLVHESQSKGPPNRSPIRWGVRSLRKPTSSTRDRNCSKNSPPACAATGPNGRESRRVKGVNASCRKSLDYSEQQDRVQAGMTPESKRAKESSQVHLRRAQVLEADAVKHPSNDKSDKTSTKQNRSNNILKLPKDMRGRWASERYTSAQLKLIDIMHERGAVPGKPILRPVLREEARKDIGDTGLLDHLLKHMTDTVVTNGERFRRRHNAAGAMEYWLEDANFMDMRIAAGIDDPFWIPPPGWKPGDGSSGTGGYDLNIEMTPAEAAEMSNLKESVDKLKRQLNCLLSQVKKTEISKVISDRANDLAANEIRRQTDNYHASLRFSNHGDEVESDVLESTTYQRLKSEMDFIREELQGLRKNGLVKQKENKLLDELQSTGKQKQVLDEVTEAVQLEERMDSTIEIRLQNMEMEIQELSKKARGQGPSLRATKNQLEAELLGLRHNIHDMQGDVLDIINRLGFSVIYPVVSHNLGTETDMIGLQNRNLIPVDSFGIPSHRTHGACEVIETEANLQTIPVRRFLHIQSEQSSLHIPSEQSSLHIPSEQSSLHISSEQSSLQIPSEQSRMRELHSRFQREELPSDKHQLHIHQGQALPYVEPARSASDIHLEYRRPHATDITLQNVEINPSQSPVFSFPLTNNRLSNATFPNHAFPFQGSIPRNGITSVNTAFVPILPKGPLTETQPTPRGPSLAGTTYTYEAVQGIPSQHGGIQSVISNGGEKTGTNANLFLDQSRLGEACPSIVNINSRKSVDSDVANASATSGLSENDPTARPFRPIASRAVQNPCGYLSKSADISAWGRCQTSFDKTETHLGSMKGDPLLSRFASGNTSSSTLSTEKSGIHFFNVLEDVLSPRVPTTLRKDSSLKDPSIKSSYQGRIKPFQLYDLVRPPRDKGYNSSLREKTTEGTQYHTIQGGISEESMASNKAQSYHDIHALDRNGVENDNNYTPMKEQFGQWQKSKVPLEVPYQESSITHAFKAESCWLGLGLPSSE